MYKYFSYNMFKYQIPLYKPYLNFLEKKNVYKCLKTKWISSKGEFVEKFENKFKKLFNYKYSLTVNNGTAALHLAVMALGIKKGDEVIVPSLTYVATANAISYTGAKVVLVDVNLNDWQISIESIKKNITKKTKAIVLVHLYGQPCDINPIIRLARKKRIKVVEDCAEALGSKYHNKFVGSFGDTASFSFYGNKTITTGEGGMVVCKSKRIYKKILKLKSQGLNLNSKKYYDHDIIGYNYRMTNICASIGLAQLSKLNSIIKKKINIFKKYKKFLSKYPIKFHEQNNNTFHTFWLINILCKNFIERNKLINFLKSKSIETRPVFIPMHKLKMYNIKKKLNNSDLISNSGISLPSFPSLKSNEIKYISTQIINFFKKNE